MSDKKQFSGELAAWVTNKWDSFDDILASCKDGNESQALGRLTYTRLEQDMSDIDDWVKVGTATVTITFDDVKDVNQRQLEVLKETLASVRAENHMREKMVLDRISNLQALTYNAPDKGE